MDKAWPEGFFWDRNETLRYGSRGDICNACCPYNPSVGITDINGKTLRVWAFGDDEHGSRRSRKLLQGGVLDIPQRFSETRCPGKTQGAGFGM